MLPLVAALKMCLNALSAALNEERKYVGGLHPRKTNFGLLPEPEGGAAPFIASTTINASILALALIISLTVKHVIEAHNTNTRNSSSPQRRLHPK